MLLLDHHMGQHDETSILGGMKKPAVEKDWADFPMRSMTDMLCCLYDGQSEAYVMCSLTVRYLQGI